ncbi:MAG: YmdB family metallophosphoesterase [Clostridia bacterium]|nr:YmdB family metallophosphoesterase [Clostridia bacterium]
MNNIKILALGDIVGPRSVEYLKKYLWKIRKMHKFDLVIANGENASEPNGIDRQTAEALFDCGVDVITTGNHIWRKAGVFSFLDDKDEILRPLNYPGANPGHGDTVINVCGYRALVMNVLGQAYIDGGSCPFDAVEKCLKQNEGRYDFAVLDIHAESTGEKKALAYNFADQVSIIYGTHTHVQTNDAQILSEKCGYITDLGMCGDNDSILGVKKEAVIYKMKTKMLSRFDFAQKGEIECCGAVFHINTDSFRCEKCEAIKFTGEIQ